MLLPTGLVGVQQHARAHLGEQMLLGHRRNGPPGLVQALADFAAVSENQSQSARNSRMRQRNRRMRNDNAQLSAISIGPCCRPPGSGA